jgi:SNF2 family DNA or RNA helicase
LRRACAPWCITAAGGWRARAFLDAVAASDLVITSYGTARRDIELLRQCTWSDLILDEAQNIKNPGAKQSQAVRRIVAHNRVALTGTPVENHLTELWSVLEFLNPATWAATNTSASSS